jgi:acetyl esterase/lipase
MKKNDRSRNFLKSLIRLLLGLIILGVSMISSQGTVWNWNGNISQDWSNPDNFQSSGNNLPGVPLPADDVLIEPWAARMPFINNGGNAVLNNVYVSKDMAIGAGGALNTTSFKLGWDASSILTVSGGSLLAGDHLDVGGYNGGTAIMNISSGSINVGGLFFNRKKNANYTVGGSQLNLTGGTLIASGALSLNKTHPCLLNIAGGTLVLPNSQRGDFNFYVGDGSLTANGMVATTNSFNIDQTTIPGSLIITAINPGFMEDTFTQWNPEVFTNLTSSLDQSMALVPPGLAVLTNANYSFGTAASTNGDIYFTEFGSARISKYNPASGTLTTVVANRPAVYGIAVDNAGNIFYAQDSAAGGGRVVRRTPGGSEQTIIANLTNPRQLATDTAGNLYVVIEAGQILKWTKSTGVTTTLLDLGQMPRLPQGVAVTADGRIYFSTYATVGARGTELAEGTVWVRETNGVIRVIAGGISRGRGIALDNNGDLYVATESSVWDNGNSGLLIKIATNGAMTRVVTGLDYPQFPAIGIDGKVYVSLARDNELVAYNPRNSFASQTISGHGLTLIAEGATWQESAGNNFPIQLTVFDTNNPADSISINGFLNITNGAGTVNMWLNIPVTNFNISLAQIPDPNNGNTNTGMFALPAVSVKWAYGSIKSFVIPLREHRRSRWPVLNDNDAALISFPSDFGETPTSYLVDLSVPISRDIRRAGLRTNDLIKATSETQGKVPSETLSLWKDQAPVGDGTFETVSDSTATLNTPATITVFRPVKSNGAMILICPGGGYATVAVDGAEGELCAKWLNELGIVGVVLNYRLPHGRPLVPLLDVQRALRMVRFNAEDWGCDVHRIGILGFSAGGHLASTAATHFDAGASKAIDPIDRDGCRPDFSLLVYPLITMGDKTHEISKSNLFGAYPTVENTLFFSNEKQVSDLTPPCFLAHAKDDVVVPPENSRLYYAALRVHHVPANYLELPSGGHGLNGYKGPMWDAWLSESVRWMAEQRIIP